MTGPAVTPVATPAPSPVVVPQAVPAPVEGSWSDVAARIAKKIPTDIAVAPTKEAAMDTERTPVIQGEAPALEPIPDGGTITIEGTAAAPPLTESVPTEATPPVMVGEIKADDADGEVVLRARDPKTGQFSDMDQTRTYELSVRDKQTGETKQYAKTLPDLMRLAKDGIGMQKQRHELDYYRQNAPVWEKTHQETTGRASELEALAVQLLTSPAHEVDALREQYANDHTPEKELARVKQQLAATRETQAAETQHRQTSQAIHTLTAKIGPAVAEVEGLLGKATAAGQLALATQSLYRDGKIPPEHFAQLEAYVTGPYLDWARQEAQRMGQVQREATASTEAARKAQQEAQRLANTTGHAIRPVGGVGADPQVKGPPKSSNDAVERIIRRQGSATIAAGSP